MTRAAGLAVSALLALASLSVAVVAAGAKVQARGSLSGAQQLYEARLGVARAQEALGSSDLHDAVASAGRANETAEKVRAITTEIADLLASAEAVAGSTSETSQRAVRNVALTRRQTRASGDLLALIAGYQRAATSFAADTNSALRRILRAVRRTNRSFPGP